LPGPAVRDDGRPLSFRRERWQLLCREDETDLRAEPLDEPTTIALLPRHAGAPGFDALAAWQRLRNPALR
jgi:hypothetical protein